MAVLREATLRDGRRVVLRPASASDADALELLYARLSSDDLHRRFFTGGHPSRSFVERWAAIADEGGYALVAVTGEPVGTIVGEAGWSLLANGNGEFGITVDPAWRGWLGPWLLDALVEQAARRGVPNLEADVLVENTPMLALVRSRGYAVVDQEDCAVVRVVIGTSGRTPSWPPRRDRPRVLAEVAGGRWRAAAEARAAGLDVITCPGPSSSPWARCPVLAGERCPLVEGADVIVFNLPLADERAQAVLASHAGLPGGIPLCVQEPASGEVPDVGRIVVRFPCGASGAEVVARLLPEVDPGS